jgi:pimeloyl-ACP methyl ester carboxylesterase
MSVATWQSRKIIIVITGLPRSLWSLAMTKEPMKPTYLNSARGHRIATYSTTGQGPRVVFCCGYRSDMASTKATALAEWCTGQNIPFTRFDYFAHGQSEGDFMDFTIGTAMADALEVIDSTHSESIILIGSSMGGVGGA